MQDVLNTPGQPLDPAARAFFEPRFGRDLGDVRISTDAAASRSAAAVGARAYTVRQRIAFASGQYAPGTPSGRSLLAHELTHVVQQSGTGATRVDRKVVDDPLMTEITQAAADAMNDAELLAQMELVRTFLTKHPDDAAVKGNLAVLEATAYTRQGTAKQVSQPSAASASGTQSPLREAPGKNSLSDGIPVNLTYTVVGMQGAAPPSGADREAIAGAVQSSALVSTSNGDQQDESRGGTWDTPGFFGAAGGSVERFVDPLPNVVDPATPNVYTRFIGPGKTSELFTPERFSGRSDLRPRIYQSAAPEEAAFALKQFREAGISSGDLGELSRALRRKGVSGLSAEESALLGRVTRVHAEVAGGTPVSPLLSLTELTPEAALARFPRTSAAPPGTIAQRAYVVRVQIDPSDVARVNELLARTGGNRLVPELEVVVGLDLAPTALRGATAARIPPRILSITRNPSPWGPLAGKVGTGLKWGGRGLAVIGAALAIRDIVTASGPNRREQEGRAFGSFAGGTVVGAFGAGLCIGLGVATAGAGLLLCGLAFGILGAVGGGALGGKVGSVFDK